MTWKSIQNNIRLILAAYHTPHLHGNKSAQKAKNSSFSQPDSWRGLLPNSVHRSQHNLVIAIIVTRICCYFKFQMQYFFSFAMAPWNNLLKHTSHVHSALWVHILLIPTAGAGTPGRICMFPCSCSFYLLHVLPGQCLTQPELRITVYKHHFISNNATLSAPPNVSGIMNLHLLYTCSTTKLFSFFRWSSYAVSAKSCLLFVSKSSSICSFIGSTRSKIAGSSTAL